MIKFLLIFLLVCSPVYAGVTINPESGSLDVTPDVQEEDGDPICYAPSGIKVTNATLTCNADGTASVVTGGGAGGGDSVTVNTASDIDTTANFKDTASVTWAVTDGGAGGPDDIEATCVESDPQVGTLTNGDMCTNDGSAVQCTVNTEAEFETAMDATNFIVSTEIDTFSELDAIVADKDLVNKADGAVWLGVHDFGGATSMEIPQNKTASTSGHVTADDTSGQFRYGANSVERVLTPNYRREFGWFDPVEAENVTFHPFKYAVTVTAIGCWVNGGTSVVITGGDGTNNFEAITCDADGAADDGSITNATFTAGEGLKLTLGTVTGEVDSFTYWVDYTITAD